MQQLHILVGPYQPERFHLNSKLMKMAQRGIQIYDQLYYLLVYLTSSWFLKIKTLCINREGVLTNIYPASVFCAVTFRGKKEKKRTDDSQVHRSVL